MKNKVYALLHIFQPVQWTRLTDFVYGSSVCYLLCSLYGKELMLSFSSTHISKSPVICYISGNEGDLIHHMLMFDHLRNVDKDFRFCLLVFFCFKALQINSVSPDYIAIVIRTHARFLINDLDARHGNVDPDPLLVLALRPSSCCHTLERKNKNTTLLKANDTHQTDVYTPKLYLTALRNSFDIFFMKISNRRKEPLIPSCTLSFIMESWHILSPRASGTSSMPISLALYLTPSP